MPKTLSETAAVLITNAATRPDLKILPVPKSLRTPVVAVRKTLIVLLRDGILIEVPANRTDEVWASTEAYGKTTLIVTPAGLAAVGIEAEAKEAPTKPRKASPPGKSSRQADRQGGASGRRGGKNSQHETKQDVVLALLRQRRARASRR